MLLWKSRSAYMVHKWKCLHIVLTMVWQFRKTKNHKFYLLFTRWFPSEQIRSVSITNYCKPRNPLFFLSVQLHVCLNDQWYHVYLIEWHSILLSRTELNFDQRNLSCHIIWSFKIHIIKFHFHSCKICEMPFLK